MRAPSASARLTSPSIRLELLEADDQSDQVPRIVGVAPRQVPDHHLQAGQDVVVDARMHDHAGRERTAPAAVGHTHRDTEAAGHVEVGVG